MTAGGTRSLTSLRTWDRCRHRVQTIEDKDNNKDYEPGNCCWATVEEQHRNRRTTLRLELDGTTRPVIEWCELLGLNYDRVLSRFKLSNGRTTKEILFGAKYKRVMPELPPTVWM